MKSALFIALSFVALTERLGAEQSDWAIVKIKAAEGRPGYLEITVHNTSKHSLELVRHWPFGGMASANVCLLPNATPGTKRFNVHPGIAMTLIAEPCHYPEGWEKYMEVSPGEAVKAILPMIHGIDEDSLGLVLTRKNGRVLVGALAKAMPKGQQHGADHPATAAESNPEGNEKPKPESEERPR